MSRISVDPNPDLASASKWVGGFVDWYNRVHLDSGIRFVTPDDRHHGHDVAILARRAEVYAAARVKRGERWAGKTRNWAPMGAVELNPIQQRPSLKLLNPTKRTEKHLLAA